MTLNRSGGFVLRTVLTVLVLLCGVWCGAAVTVGVARSTPSFMASLEPPALHGLGLRALELDLRDSDVVVALNSGPLYLSKADITRILYGGFAAEDTWRKAHEVHAGLVEFVTTYPRDSVFLISIARERPILVQALEDTLLPRYRALPECGIGDDLSALFSALETKLGGDSGQEFFAEAHPQCRPPDLIADRVYEGIQRELERVLVHGADSVAAFPGDPGDLAFANTMATLQAVLAWSEPVRPISISVLAMLAWLLVSGRPYRPWIPLGIWATGALAYGIVVRLGSPGLVTDRFATLGVGSESGRAWAELGAYAVEQVAIVSSTGAIAVGTVLVLGALALELAGRRSARFSGSGTP